MRKYLMTYGAKEVAHDESIRKVRQYGSLPMMIGRRSDCVLQVSSSCGIAKIIEFDVLSRKYTEILHSRDATSRVSNFKT